MNRIIGLGNLTRDVELRYTGSNMAMARFTVALRRDVKNKEGKYDSDFVSCIAYQKLAETIKKYFQKGSKIAFEGRIQSGSYENSKGEKVYTTDVVVEKINFVDKLENKEESKKTSSEVARDVATSNDAYAAMGEQVAMDTSRNENGSSLELPF